MDEYYRAIRLLPSWLAGPLGQLPAQTAAQIHELRFRTGCGVFVTLSGRQLPLQDLPECPLQLRECVLDQFQIEEIFHTLCGGAVHAHQTELAHGFLTTPSGCRVGVAGRYVDRDGQTVLQQVQGLNLRIARAVPVQLPDELLAQLKKHFIGMLLVGEPDSGKTTLLRCLNFLTTPDEGKILVNGETLFDADDPATQKESEIRRKRLHFGLVFQNFNLFPQYTALQNVMLASELLAKEQPDYHARKKELHEEIRQNAEKLLKDVGLGEKMNLYPHQLSGGQQQRVAIARALALKPDILCFDEPTSALDPELTGEVLRVIRSLAEQKMTMIIVTHEMAFARDVADRVIFMDGGVIVEQGESHQVIEHPTQERTRQFLSRYAEN